MSPQSPSPRIRLRDTERKPEADALSVIFRISAAALVVLSPVTAVCIVLLIVVIPLVKWVRPRWFLLAGAVLLLVSFFAGGFRAFFAPYRALVKTALDAGSVSTIPQEVLQYLGDHWVGMAAVQLWFGVPVALVVAAVVAAVRGRYKAEWRQKQNTKATPKTVARKQAKAAEWPQTVAPTLDDVKIRLGMDQFAAKPWDLPVSALRHHAFVVGPSGFGKTTTLVELIRGLVQAPAAQPYKIGTVFMTMKPDPTLTEALKALGTICDRKVHIITEDGTGATTTYNPLRHGTAAQRRNVLIEAEANSAGGGFSEPHYRITGSRFTLLALRALDWAASAGETYTVAGDCRRWTIDLAGLARMMRQGNVEHIGQITDDRQLAADIKEFTAEVEEDSSTAAGVGGMRTRFANIAEGAAGAVLCDEPDGLDLREAIRDGDIVIFDLDASADADAAQYVANLAIRDWTASMAALNDENWHGGSNDPQRMNALLVDEFSGLGGAALKDSLARTRGQGGAVILSTQSYGELGDTSMLGFRSALMTNTSVKLLHHTDDGSEEDLATIAGTREGWKETTQTFEDRDLLGMQTRASGQGSLREVEEFKIHPNELRDLDPGEIIALVRHPKEHTRVKVRFTPPKSLSVAAAAATEKPEDETADDEPEEKPSTTDDKPQQQQSVWSAAADAAADQEEATTKPAWDDGDDDAMNMPVRDA